MTFSELPSIGLCQYSQRCAILFKEHIDNTQFSSKLKNGSDKHECYITKLSKGSTVTKTLAYRAHSQVTMKIKGCDYGPRCLFYKTLHDCCKIHLKRNVRIKLQFRCLYWRSDTQHNDIQHNDTQPKGLRCDTQHNNDLPLCCVSLCRLLRFIYFYIESNNAECCCSELS